MTNITYRVLVSTDLGGDPDDIQALIHLLHYSDILKIEGIVSSPGPASVNRVEHIREWIERADLDHLRAHGHSALMAEAEVLEATCQGATAPGHPAPGKDTAGSRLIVERALASDSLGLDHPLWVLAWGALTDVAQALHDEPAQESWGGQFRRPESQRFPNYYVDLDAPPEVCQATINKWRVHFLRSWKERWSWYAK